MTIDGIDNNKYLITKDFLLGTTKVFNKDSEDSDNSTAEVENIDIYTTGRRPGYWYRY